MAYHTLTPYKKKAFEEVKTRTQTELSADKLSSINSTISTFITKFKAKHLS